MPLFYFDIVDGFYIKDEEGQELASLEAAREEAVKSARSILREEVWKGRLPLSESIRVLDGERRLLCDVPFHSVVTID